MGLLQGIKDDIHYWIGYSNPITTRRWCNHAECFEWCFVDVCLVTDVHYMQLNCNCGGC